MTTTDAAAGAIDLPARAEAVAELADAHAADADAQGCLTAPVVEALHREGLLGMWVPRSIRGGAELDPVSSLRVLEQRVLRRSVDRLGADGGRRWRSAPAPRISATPRSTSCSAASACR